MTWEILFVLVLALVAVLLFVTEWVRPDLVALLVMSSVAIAGIISAEDAIKGFANSATLTVMNMFILSEAIFRTGALNLLGERIIRISGNNQMRACVLLMLLVGVTSMFINNTAAVALLIPMIIEISRRSGWSPSKILMPVSFASMVGGTCTLIGTSTNLLANGFLSQKGYPGLSMFSFFEYGMVFFVVGFIYMYFVGVKLIEPRRKFQDLGESFELENYIFNIEVEEESPLIGQNFTIEQPLESSGVRILFKETEDGNNENVVCAGDILRVRADIEALYKVKQEQRIKILSTSSQKPIDYNMGEKVYVEVVVTPNSRFEGQYFSKTLFFEDYDAEAVAIRQRKGIKNKDFDRIQLSRGDTILLLLPKQKVHALRESYNFVVIRLPEAESFKYKKLIPTLLIMFAVISLAALNMVPIVITSFLGVCGVVVLKTINLNDAYKAVDWQVVFLLAGLLALGEAMNQSGAAELFSKSLVQLVQPYGEVAIFTCFFGMTVLLTSFMSNNASVALMTPLAIYSAQSLDMDVVKMVLTVMFGASMSFITPIGYQTNMMIYNVGHYKFRDYLIVGGPLTLIFLGLVGFILI